MSIRKHRQEARLRTHARAEATGKTADTRGPWLHRKTARQLRRAARHVEEAAKAREDKDR